MDYIIDLLYFSSKCTWWCESKCIQHMFSVQHKFIQIAWNVLMSFLIIISYSIYDKDKNFVMWNSRHIEDLKIDQHPEESEKRKIFIIKNA